MSTVAMLTNTTEDKNYTPPGPEVIVNDLTSKMAKYLKEIQNHGYRILYDESKSEFRAEPDGFLNRLITTKETAVNALCEKVNACLMKVPYADKKVNDDVVNYFLNNIRTYTQGTEDFNKKLAYYKNLIATKNYQYPEGLKKNGTETNFTGDFDLEEYVKFRGPVIVAQEFYGCGARSSGNNSDPDGHILGRNENNKFKTEDEAESFKLTYNLTGFMNTHLVTIGDTEWVKKEKCFGIPIDIKTKPKFDVYDDRITKIYYDGTNIIIKEFNRANVDVSIKYWENLLIRPRQCKSTASFVFDFIVGVFSGTKEDSLFLFDYNLVPGVINKINNSNLSTQMKTARINAINEEVNKYKNNTCGDYEVFTADKGVLNQLRNAPDIKGDNKFGILIHRGYRNYTSSKGCLTIFGDSDNAQNSDYNSFKSGLIRNKFGLAFLFRDEL